MALNGDLILHRVVILRFIPDLFIKKERQEQINLLKKYIGYVRTVPVKGSHLGEPDYFCGSHVHGKLSNDFCLYSPGSSNCAYSKCKYHGIFVSRTCSTNDASYTNIANVSVSDWDNVLKFIKETKNGEQDLCLCFKLKNPRIKISDKYRIFKIDDDHYTFDIADPYKLEYICDIGSSCLQVCPL